MSVDAGEDAVFYLGLVLGPLVGAVFFGAMPVVVTLTEGEQGDDEGHVNPGPRNAEVTKGQGDGQG